MAVPEHLDLSLFRRKIPVLPLPPTFRDARAISSYGYREGSQVLNDYCVDCTRKPVCPMNHYTREAMGENYTFWPNNFVHVTGSLFEGDGFPSGPTQIVCADYQSPQLGIAFPGRENSEFDDALSRLFAVYQTNHTRELDCSSPFEEIIIFLSK